MRRNQEAILISPRKVVRDLLILVPVIALGVWGVRQSGWLEPAVAADVTPAQLAVQREAPTGTNTDVLAVLALLDRESPTVMAVIAGQEVTQGDLDEAVYKVLTRVNPELQKNIKPEISADFERVRAFYNRVRETALELAVDARGLEPDPADIDARMAEIKAGFESEAAFNEQLALMESDEVALRALTRESMREEMLRAAVLDELKVSPDSPDAESAYQGWLTDTVATLDVQVLDPRFRESMQKLLTLFKDAPEHAAGALPMDPSVADIKENGPMDTERQ